MIKNSQIKLHHFVTTFKRVAMEIIFHWGIYILSSLFLSLSNCEMCAESIHVLRIVSIPYHGAAPIEHRAINIVCSLFLGVNLLHAAYYFRIMGTKEIYVFRLNLFLIDCLRSCKSSVFSSVAKLYNLHFHEVKGIQF